MRELHRALREGTVIEVEMDLYLFEDGREARYDRFRRGAYKWVCDGVAYRSFFELENKLFGRPIA